MILSKRDIDKIKERLPKVTKIDELYTDRKSGITFQATWLSSNSKGVDLRWMSISKIELAL